MYKHHYPKVEEVLNFFHYSRYFTAFIEILNLKYFEKEAPLQWRLTWTRTKAM